MGKQSIAGIVIKVTKADIVLLCQDGTFQNVARSPQVAPPLIGERYTHIKKTTSWLKYTSIAAVFLLTFISYLLLPFGQGDSAYVVAIDINPSIELTVNNSMKVIETNANNPDGETLLATVEMDGDQLAVAIKKISNYSEAAGFFLEGKYLTTSVIPIKKQKDQLTEKVERIVKESMDKPDIEVVVLRNNKATYDEAKKQDLSVNHYAYFKELENHGVVKTIDEVRGKSMAELRKMQKAEKDKGPSGNGPKQTKPSKPGKISKPDSVGPTHKEIKTNQDKPGKPDSDDPAHERTKKANPQSQSQAQQKKQQAESSKGVQEKPASQNKGQDHQGKSTHKNPSRKEGSKQEEFPNANGNGKNNATPANKDQ